MQIVHSRLTATQKPKAASSTEGGAAEGLAGAFKLEPHVDSEAAIYVIVPAEKLERILDAKDPTQHIIGDTEEAVEAELNRRHPPPRSELTYICRDSHIPRSVPNPDYKNNSWHKRDSQFTTKSFDGWVVLPKPQLIDCRNLAELQSICVSVGPVLMTGSLFKKVFDCENSYNDNFARIANAVDFTYSPRSIGGMTALCQVNYNPSAMARRDFRQKKTGIENLHQGSFPETVLHSLMACIEPANWPHCHPYYGVTRGIELTRKSGWNHETNIEFSPGEIVAMLDFNRRLWKETWWRERDRNYGTTYSNWMAVLSAAAPFVVGVERLAKAKIAKEAASLREEYDRYVSGRIEAANWWHDFTLEGNWQNEGGGEPPPMKAADPEKDVFFREALEEMYRRYAEGEASDRPKPPIPWNTYRASHIRADDSHGVVLRLCRFIRRECRALKIVIPRPPAIPKPPKKKAKRKKGKRRAR